MVEVLCGDDYLGGVEGIMGRLSGALATCNVGMAARKLVTMWVFALMILVLFS